MPFGNEECGKRRTADNADGLAAALLDQYAEEAVSTEPPLARAGSLRTCSLIRGLFVFPYGQAKVSRGPTRLPLRLMSD